MSKYNRTSETQASVIHVGMNPDRAPGTSHDPSFSRKALIWKCLKSVCRKKEILTKLNAQAGTKL